MSTDTKLNVEANDQSAHKIIHLWCGPRSLSTATLYSFSQRSDTLGVDEPLYASYLAKHPHIHRPYRDALMNVQNSNGNAVLRSLAKGFNSNKKIIFSKHLCKQLAGLDGKLIVADNITNIFLIRNPLAMILSWEAKGSVHQEPCSLSTMGLPTMLHLFSELRQVTGSTPIVIDSDLLQQAPEEVLKEACARINIPFEESMLSWSAGPKPVDGIWASHWYDKVHKSKGFGAFVDGPGNVKVYNPLTPDEIELYREALPYYETLRRHAIGVDHLCPGTSRLISEAGLHKTPRNVPDPRLSDPRNANILLWIGDTLVPRELGKISAFDSAVQGGDAVWEGLRVYNGGVFMLDAHLDRLVKSAKAMAFAHIPTKDFIRAAIKRTLVANGMYDGAHMRLTLTRGAKITSSMNPKFNIFGSNLIIVPEWKPVGDPATYDNASGVALITASNRRNPPQCVDSKIHHCNLINNILPKIQANVSGAADAIMLDIEGFVSETNATNLFCVKDSIVYTPYADHCLPGVTRGVVMDLVKYVLKIAVQEKRLSLFEFHTADEVFTTGTMGEITPVTMIDGRLIGSGKRGPVTSSLQEEYSKLTNLVEVILK